MIKLYADELFAVYSVSAGLGIISRYFSSQPVDVASLQGETHDVSSGHHTDSSSRHSERSLWQPGILAKIGLAFFEKGLLTFSTFFGHVIE